MDYKRYLGIDYGKKRIGLALTDPLLTFASPYLTIENNNQCLDKIKNIINEKDVVKIILGYPDPYEKEPTEVCKDIILLKSKLEEYCQIEVVLWDENFSSSIAQYNIIESVPKKSKRREKGLIDRNAAAVILQEYLSTEK